MTAQISDKPEKGAFYYHFKHDDNEGVAHYAYEVVGFAQRASDESIDVNYRPLYKRLDDADYWSRQLTEWMEPKVDGMTISKRFTRITDPELISKLQTARKEVYGGE